jgi:hypothetical protein
MIYPQTYTEDAYIAWHEQEFPADAPLKDKLTNIRESLKNSALGNLKVLDELLQYMRDYATKEYNFHKDAMILYTIPLSTAVIDPAQPSYDALFKPVESTINKLWRLNRQRPAANRIQLATLTSNIFDLVRTNITAATLDSAGFLSERIGKGLAIIHDHALLSKLKPEIVSIESDPNMQMDKGYFAYHGRANFTSDLIVEIQIFSGITTHWRKLNHIFYEVVRSKPMEVYNFGQTETRLISLGHMLHLAECEIARLENELATVGKR